MFLFFYSQATLYSTTDYLYPSDGIYYIRNAHSWKWLDIVRSTTSGNSGDPAIQFDRVDGNPSQQWKFYSLGGGWYRIAPMFNTNKTLNVHNSLVANTANNATINIWDYVGASSQKWKIISNGDGTIRFISQSGNKALEVANGSFNNYTQLSQRDWQGSNNNNQRWVIENLEGDELSLSNWHLVDSTNHLDIEMHSNMTAYQILIGAAAEKWNDWSIANGLGATIRWKTSSTTRDVLFYAYYDYNDINKVAYTSTGGLIAVNTAVFEAPHFDNNKKQELLTHEIGHALGLDHTFGDWNPRSNMSNIMKTTGFGGLNLSLSDRNSYRHAFFKY